MDWINEEGGFNAEATDMPENVKSLVDAKGYKGVTDLADAYTNAASKLGVSPERLMTLPDKPDDVEGWGNVYAKLGKPETADAYKPDVSVPEGLQLDDNLVKEFSAAAHEMNLTNAQLSKVMQFQLDASDKYVKMSAVDAAKAEEVAAADAKNAREQAWEALKVQHSVKTDADLKVLYGCALQPVR